MDVEELLAAGRAALAAGDWSLARRSFEAALGLEEAAEALAGLSDALWWLGESEAAVRSGERAYAPSVASGRRPGRARRDRALLPLPHQPGQHRRLAWLAWAPGTARG